MYSNTELRIGELTRLLTFLNPTKAQIYRTATHETRHKATDGQGGSYPLLVFGWTSRNNRKGRHVLLHSPSFDGSQSNDAVPPHSRHLRSVSNGIVRMFAHFPVWDISYLIAIIFVLGSLVWVLRSLFGFLPLYRPEMSFPGEKLIAGGISAFIGVCLFELGGILTLIEAFNESREECFGWAVEKVFERNGTSAEKGTEGWNTRQGDCWHHHANRQNLVGRGVDPPQDAYRLNELHTTGGETEASDQESWGEERKMRDRSWTWFPTMHEIKSHYIHSLGFIAASIQISSTSIYFISGLLSLPGLYNNLSPTQLDIFYRGPQVIAGLGFITASTLFTLETQRTWFTPAPDVLGWHIGVWNVVGSVGFFLSPAFAYYGSEWAVLQSSISPFWGSVAFLIGSVLQWYESLDKYPVEKTKEW